MPNRFRLDFGAVQRFLRDPTGPVERLIRELTDKAANFSRTTVPVRTGETRSSIDTDFYQGASDKDVRVGQVSASYAVFFLQKGTKPHLIVAHGDYSLNHEHIDYFGPVVFHPGITPRPFLTEGLWSIANDV